MKTLTHNPLSKVTTLAACLLLAAPISQAQTGDAQYFTEVAPGVVKDSRTGLEWMRCSLGQQWSASANTCTGKIKEYNWQGAQDVAKKFNAMVGDAGKTGWRVPTIRELQSIRYCSTGFRTSTENLQDGQPAVPGRCNNGSAKPTIDLATFPATPVALYWSSTPSAGDASDAWFVDFGDGIIHGGDYRDYLSAVRLVR